MFYLRDSELEPVEIAMEALFEDDDISLIHTAGLLQTPDVVLMPFSVVLVKIPQPAKYLVWSSLNLDRITQDDQGLSIYVVSCSYTLGRFSMARINRDALEF